MEQITNITNQTPIEIALGVDENGMTTAKKLYSFLELDKSHYASWVKRNILENEFAEKGIDFYSHSSANETGRGNFAQDYKLTAAFAKKLSMTAKNERGEEARNYFLKVEDKLKDVAIEAKLLSPELQMFQSLFNAVAKNELDTKRSLEQSQKALDAVDGIKEIVSISSVNWRKDTTGIINKIALKLGGYENIKAIREESYKALEQRIGVQLSIRVTNIKKNLALNGVCKSKIDKVNQLDAIDKDKKLIEGYVAIVKEMAIKYGIQEEMK